MNQRNVDALAQVIAETGLALGHDSWVRAMAKALALRGVLVASAVEYEDLCTIVEGFDSYDWFAEGEVDTEGLRALRERLEQVANLSPDGRT